MNSRILFLFLSVLAATTISTPATADLRCSLVSSLAGISDQKGPEFILRQQRDGSEVIWLSDWYGTLVLNCINALVDKYECYGFGPLPGKTPLQLNIVDLEPGSTVAFTALNPTFLKYYAARQDVDTRRFSIDIYQIAECR